MNCCTLTDSWWKCLFGLLLLLTGMGSFDSVRLAPHFAQEDRGIFGLSCDLLTEKFSIKPTTEDHDWFANDQRPTTHLANHWLC
jgi:hypothetical protein